MDFPFPSFFLSVLKVTNTFVLHVNGSCNIHGITSTVRDVTMMYCKEWYIENVPKKAKQVKITHVKISEVHVKMRVAHLLKGNILLGAYSI